MINTLPRADSGYPAGPYRFKRPTSHPCIGKCERPFCIVVPCRAGKSRSECTLTMTLNDNITQHYDICKTWLRSLIFV